VAQRSNDGQSGEKVGMKMLLRIKRGERRTVQGLVSQIKKGKIRVKAF